MHGKKKILAFTTGLTQIFTVVLQNPPVLIEANGILKANVWLRFPLQIERFCASLWFCWNDEIIETGDSFTRL